MRTWAVDSANSGAVLPGHALAGLIGQLAQPHFDTALLAGVHPVLPAASCAIYRTGRGITPRLFMSASQGIPDTTRDCWRAYLAGPQRSDRTLSQDGATGPAATAICHITAAEVPAAHRASVYEAHGVSERVSVVQREGDSLFAVNFYRHRHQRPFSDAQLADFESMAPALLALTQKHIALDGHTAAPPQPLQHWRQRLQQTHQGLTARELDVCARLLMGMTQDGIAADLYLSLPTVKTYRNRAFARLGIHFRNELFALFLHAH